MRTNLEITLTGALRVAAVQYAIDAEVASREPGHERIVEQFKRQAAEANELADDIDESGSLTAGFKHWQNR